MSVFTYRERREAKAERLREWADKRESKSEAASAQASQMAKAIPLGQPILVDHYSAGRDMRYRARIQSTMSRAVEHSRKADEMRSRAANIDAAAERAIYADDPDAIERLEQKLATLEAERDRIKAYNASCRKGAPDAALLDEHQRRQLVSCANARQLKPNGAFPGYATSNLGGTITTTRKRLDALRSQHEVTE